MLAEQKGEKPGTWKLYTVLAWFGLELTIMITCMAVMGEDTMIIAALFGLAGGFLGYLIVREMLNKKPDQENELDSLAGHLD